MAFLIRDSLKGRCLFTTEFIPKGKIIRHLNKEKVSKEVTYQTIQVGKGLHFLQDDFFSNMNHSCNPTTIIDTKNYVVIANKDIHPGEEINFFYPSTEWNMVQPFHCKCGSKNCIEFVNGARDLSVHYINQFFINDHIKEEMMNVIGNNGHNYEIVKEEIIHEDWHIETVNI